MQQTTRFITLCLFQDPQLKPHFKKTIEICISRILIVPLNKNHPVRIGYGELGMLSKSHPLQRLITQMLITQRLITLNFFSKSGMIE